MSANTSTPKHRQSTTIGSFCFCIEGVCIYRKTHIRKTHIRNRADAGRFSYRGTTHDKT